MQLQEQICDLDVRKATVRNNKMLLVMFCLQSDGQEFEMLAGYKIFSFYIVVVFMRYK